MVLRGWLFTDLIAPRCRPDVRYTRSFFASGPRSLAARHANLFAPTARALLLGWLFSSKSQISLIALVSSAGCRICCS